jgi:predicted nucleic acid-binding protein
LTLNPTRIGNQGLRSAGILPAKFLDFTCSGKSRRDAGATIILPLAREYDLSAYDAAYLDVAVRHGAPLATLDATLQKAGRAAGIKIFKV